MTAVSDVTTPNVGRSWCTTSGRWPRRAACRGTVTIDGVVDLAEIARRGMPFPIGVGIRHRADGTPALHPLEEQSLGHKAIERRRVYFSMGRAAARDALAEFGIYSVAIERGPSGEPLWPDGIVGAISHAGDVAIAIVGRQNKYAGLGIDIEQLSRGL